MIRANKIGSVMAAMHAAIPHIQDETAFRKRVEEESRSLFDAFTDEENMMIAFAPLVISHVAWHYTEIVLQECAEKKIQATKPLSRAVKEMRQLYVSELRKDLNASHVNHIEEQCNEFINECAYDFTILWWSVNQAIKSRYPDCGYIELRTNAYCAIIAIRVLREHVSDMNKFMASRVPNAQQLPIHPHMNGLEILLDAYMSDFTIDETESIMLCRKIFKKNIGKIEWGVIKD